MLFDEYYQGELAAGVDEAEARINAMQHCAMNVAYEKRIPHTLLPDPEWMWELKDFCGLKRPVANCYRSGDVISFPDDWTVRVQGEIRHLAMICGGCPDGWCPGCVPVYPEDL